MTRKICSVLLQAGIAWFAIGVSSHAEELIQTAPTISKNDIEKSAARLELRVDEPSFGDSCPSDKLYESWRGPSESLTAIRRIKDFLEGGRLFPREKATIPAYEDALRARLRQVPESQPGSYNWEAQGVKLMAEQLIQQKMATAYASYNVLQEALKHYTLAIAAQNDPRNDIAWDFAAATNYFWRATILRRLGRNEEALADFRNAQKLGCRGLEEILADISTKIAAVRRSTELVVDAQRRGAEAEQKGDFRGALGIYIQALGTVTPGELPAPLVAKAIEAAAKLTPPPPIPQEARKHAVFAQTAFKEAKSKDDFNEASAQYSRTLALAPWWADAWVTLSAVHEKLGNFAAAMGDLENYLRAAPRAPDRDEVQNKIYELQYKAQKSAK